MSQQSFIDKMNIYCRQTDKQMDKRLYRQICTLTVRLESGKVIKTMELASKKGT